MSNSKKNGNTDLWLSLGFFLVYAGYFISYFYEMFYIFRYNFDFLLFGSIFLCSVSSVMLTSVCLMVIAFILIIICASMEMYFYVDFMFVLFPKENFLRLFFYGRICGAMLYIIMFVFYINNAKMVREQEMEELKEIEEHIKDYNRRVVEAAAHKNRRANESLAQKKAQAQAQAQMPNQNGPMQNIPMQNIPMQNGPIQNGPIQNGQRPNPQMYYPPQGNVQVSHYYPTNQPGPYQQNQYVAPRTDMSGNGMNGEGVGTQPQAGVPNRHNGITENSFGVRTNML